MSRNRTYSFDSDHGASPQRGRYQDSPERPTIISPPPQYFTQPQNAPEPVSPVEAYRPISNHSRVSSRYDTSFDGGPRNVAIPHSEDVPPLPPAHRSSPSRQAYRPESNVTTGMDNYGPYAQGGGLTYVAQEVADHNQRQSGLEAARGLPQEASPSYFHSDRDYPMQNTQYAIPRRPVSRVYPTSSSSGIPLTAAAATPGAATPHEFSYDTNSAHHSMRSLPHSYYSSAPADQYDDSPYHQRYGHYPTAVQDADIMPQNIVDDGDDGFMPEPKRKSVLPLSRERSREGLGNRGHAVAAGAAAGTGAALGGLFGRKEKNVSSSGSYNAVSASDGPALDKSEWLSRQTKGNNKMRWVVGVAIGAVVVLAVIAGIVGGVLGTRHSSSGGGGGSASSINNAADDTAANGDLDINSGEIKALMNNKNLHKVFPGMDYTPWGVQYPLCLTYPPSQNNVTRDMAIMSQLTNAVRLYGTDCNQTEMVLHAIDRLQLKNMKVWLGVWIDTNQTTTDRQLSQMYKILADTKDRTIFKGVIIGNEALFRAGQDKASSHAELVSLLGQAQQNFTKLGYDLTVSTSDLGDNWDGTLASASHYVMSNVHPFFAGVNVQDAAAWTWNFWQTHDVVLTGDQSRQVVSETGWPSGGGTDCGNAANQCAAGQTGSVASVDNMNIFMNNWVCQALNNGTNYFWFSAFDEAWKIAYNTVSNSAMILDL